MRLTPGLLLAVVAALVWFALVALWADAASRAIPPGL
jgi:hypothetical protein